MGKKVGGFILDLSCAVVLGIQIYILLDNATNGELTREVKRILYVADAERRQQAKFEHDRKKMLFDAHYIVRTEQA